MVFNTIKSSKRVFDYLSEYADEYGFEIDLLNSSLMPSSKKEIISKVNNFKSDEFSDKKYLLISTQSVEAGVDVSFDFVVRDFAIIDSIEQVRGRCNRSGELNKRFNDLDKKGNVYLVNFDDGNNSFYEYIYDKEEQKTRIECTKCLVYDSLNYSYENIQEYYSNVSSKINQINNDKKDDFRYNEWDNIDYLNKTEYSKIKDKDTGIHIINNDQKQFSIFISTDLNVMSNNLEKQFSRLYDCSIFELDESELIKFYDENKNDFIFSANEILFIKSKGQDLYENNKILANSLLNYYESLFNQDKSDFNYYKLIRKEFASILYKFIINISVNSYEEIYSEIEDLQSLGFFKILPKEKIGEESDSFYSLKRGFNFKPNNLNMEFL